MADKKISQLTGATTPLAGSEVLPIVQGGSTVKVSVDNLTSGKSVSATSFVPTGSTVPANGVYLPAANTVGISSNSTQVCSVEKTKSFALEGATPQTGTGITFPATQSASSNVNTLDDYKEGAWTATVSGATIDNNFSSYTKIGRMVVAEAHLAFTGGSFPGATFSVGGLPYTSGSARCAVSIVFQDESAGFAQISGPTAVLNDNSSSINVNTHGAITIASDDRLNITCVYFV